MGKRDTPDLRRKKFRREPRQRFVLFCEGKVTEPAYFDALRRYYLSAIVEIQTIGAVGVPYTVATRAVEHAKALGLTRGRRSKLNLFEERDQVWAIFDRDDHPRFDDAVDLCRRNRVECGRSNPCFELWLILHIEAFDRPDDRTAVQSHLQEIHREYDASGSKKPNCDALVSQVEQAEERAQRQLKRREAERAPFGCPSTTVGMLTSAIRKAAYLAV